MKFALLLVAIVMAAIAVEGKSYLAMFQEFKAKHGRVYATKQEEKLRFGNFVANMKTAKALQATNPLATFGVNEFSDISAAEFKIRHSAEKFYAKKVAERKNIVSVPTNLKATQIDWRAKGAVTYVKNQGQCGSCWAFSSTGSIEGQWFLAGNTLTAVSEQELTSCDTIDSGCGGGIMSNAWTWLISDNGGNIATEASYPYVSGNGVAPACTLPNGPNGPLVNGATITNYVSVTANEQAMGQWVYANGPMSVAVDATSWQTYTGGILTNCISNQIDHGVLVVGYDDTNQPPYWIVKNSWGGSWGESGYIRVQKGTDQCLITTDPCSSVVGSGPAPTTGTPAPNAPPTPGAGTFTESKCTDFGCTNCETKTNPTGTCINGGSFSFIASCASDGIVFSYYSGSGCSGAVQQTTIEPINMCQLVQDFAGDYFSQLTCNAGPAPTWTPAPNSPPNPTPAPSSGGTFTQMNCVDSACSQGCSNNTFQQNVCIPVNGGGSALVTCIPGYLNFTEYATSTCSGPGQNSPMPLNQCLQGGEGSFENFCSSTSSTAPISTKKMTKLKKF